MSTPGTIVILNALKILGLPDLPCFTNFEDLLKSLPEFLGLELPDSITNVVFSTNEPLDHGVLWVVSNNAGEIVDLRVYSNGAWVSFFSLLDLANNQWLRARNAADTADINILKIDTSDRLEVGPTIFGTISSYLGVTTGLPDLYSGCLLVGGCLTTYAAGMHLTFTAHQSSVTTVPQLDAGFGFRNIIDASGRPLNIGDIQINGLYEVEYNGSLDQFLLLNPSCVWFSYTPDLTQPSTMTYGATTVVVAKARIRFNTMDILVTIAGTTGGAAVPFIRFGVPRTMVAQEIGGIGRTDDGAGTLSLSPSLCFYSDATHLAIALPGGGNWGIGAGRNFIAQARVQIV